MWKNPSWKYLLNEMIPCVCGCGAELNQYDKYGNKRKGYIPGHQLSESRKTGILLDKRGGGIKGNIPWNKGIKMSPESCKNYFGRKATDEHKRKIGAYHIGEKNTNWKGGISKEVWTIRGSSEMREFIKEVKKRDKNVCQKCLVQMNTKKVTAHHILNFSTHVDLRTDINNGITFCIDCHKLFHITYGFKKNDREQLNEFIKAK